MHARLNDRQAVRLRRSDRQASSRRIAARVVSLYIKIAPGHTRARSRVDHDFVCDQNSGTLTLSQTACRNLRDDLFRLAYSACDLELVSWQTTSLGAGDSLRKAAIAMLFCFRFTARRQLNKARPNWLPDTYNAGTSTSAATSSRIVPRPDRLHAALPVFSTSCVNACYGDFRQGEFIKISCC